MNIFKYVDWLNTASDVIQCCLFRRVGEDDVIVNSRTSLEDITCCGRGMRCLCVTIRTDVCHY